MCSHARRSGGIAPGSASSAHLLVALVADALMPASHLLGLSLNVMLLNRSYGVLNLFGEGYASSERASDQHRHQGR